MSKTKGLIFIVIIIVIVIFAYLGIGNYNSEIQKKYSNNETIEEEQQVSSNNDIEFIAKYTETDFTNNPDYKYVQDMQLTADGFRYKKITTYKQYLEDLKKWPGLVQVEEKDFNKNFIIVIAGENYSTTSLYVNNISVDENNTYINLKPKEQFDERAVILIKLSRDLERENIVIINNPTVPDVGENFIKMEDISTGYSIEQAISDGCFVIKYNKVISNDKVLMDKFIENCNNGIDGFIRLYIYNLIENANIVDVEYKNGKINMSSKNITQENAQIGGYKSGNKINIINSETEGSKVKAYYLEDEIGNRREICRIEL